MSWGFESPLWLAGTAILIPLAWLYLRRRKRPPAVVSSLLVWQAVARPLAAHRPRLPLLFFIQALLVSACLTAIAAPFVLHPAPEGPARDAVVVIDLSASMQARLGGGTRFDAARAAARERVAELADDAKGITLIAADLQPNVLGTGLSGSQAVALLDRTRPVDTAGNLTAAIELAATHAGPEGTVDLFTDTPREDLVLSRDARDATAVHRFGEGGENVGFTALRVVASPFEDAAHARVLLSVRNFSRAPREVAVDVAPLGESAPLGAAGSDGAAASGASSSDSPAPPRADADASNRAAGGSGASRTHQTVTLAPGETVLLSFDGLPFSGLFRASLAGGDDLALDDQAYGFLQPRRTLPVVVVTDDPAFSRAIEGLARKLGNVTVRSVAPPVYRPGLSNEVTLFDRVAPPIPPSGSAAYFAPRQGNADVSIVGAASDARFAEVRDHELLAGVENPETLLSGKLIALATGTALRPVVIGRSEGRDAALVLAGEVGGRRVVATAFPLRPESLSDADALPSLVFTLNLLRWLAPAGDEAPLLRVAGERLRAGSPEATSIQRLEGPDGSRALGPTEEVSLEHAGLYRAVGATRSRPLAVNFFDPIESDIARPPISAAQPAFVPSARARRETPAGPAVERRPHVRELLLAALLAMLVEWPLVAWMRTRRRGASRAAIEGPDAERQAQASVDGGA
jgi:VWA domain-containing protein/aerotolerance regulator-like protein